MFCSVSTDVVDSFYQMTTVPGNSAGFTPATMMEMRDILDSEILKTDILVLYGVKKKQSCYMQEFSRQACNTG